MRNRLKQWFTAYLYKITAERAIPKNPPKNLLYQCKRKQDCFFENPACLILSTGCIFQNI